MGLVGLLRVLWRRRIIVGVGAVLAIVAAVVGIQRGADATPTSSSLTKVLIDTPNSLVADARANGAATIYTRARLVGGLVADDSARAAIARRAGLSPSELAIAGPGAAAPPSAITPLATQAIAVAKPVAPYLVSVEVAPSLPIVSVTASAPDQGQAARLGRAAVDTLSSVARDAPGGGASVAIEQLGSPLIATKAVAGGKAKPVAAALVLFLLWCLACAIFDSVARRRSLGKADLSAASRALG